MDVISLKQYIYENGKIEFILENLGCHNIKYNESKEYYSAAHNDGDNPQGINISNNKYLNYRSFSRDVTYDDNEDLISLVQYTKKITFVEAIKYVHNILGLEYSAFSKKKKENKKVSEVEEALKILKYANKRKYVDVSDIEILDEDLLDNYVPMLHIDFYREGIMPWTRKKFGLMYSYKYKRVIIPIRYWATGELVGTNARTMVKNYDELGIKKYYITPSYKKHLNLYGLYENYDSIQKAGYCCVYESEKSVLKRDSLLDSTGLAISGKNMSEEQIRIAIGLDVDIVLALDNDVDEIEVFHIAEKFYKSRNVYYIKDKWGLIPEKSCIADCSNKVFNFLMEHRKKYGAEEHRIYQKSLKRK